MGKLRLRMTMVEFNLPFEQPLAAAGSLTHRCRDGPLSDVQLHHVEFGRQEIVVRRGDLVHQHRCQHSIVQQVFGLDQIHQTDTGHYGRTVGDGQPLTLIDF